MPKPLILIVGVQKSGTTLLMRLLEQTGACISPFPHEGDEFWGNVPPFEPQAFPVGTIYQRSAGADGHEIGLDDATDEVRRTLHDRLAAAPVSRPVIVNKSPYNTVRLPWIRAVFPKAFVVSLVRAPEANVYSLMKKHIPHPGRGHAPTDGWWGVKPRGWRQLVDPDKTVQCSRQWNAVNQILLRDAGCVDLFLGYRQLCENPNVWVTRILNQATGGAAEVKAALSPVRCFDHEYAQGSRLKSKNRSFRATGSLMVAADEPIEIAALNDTQVAVIQAVCGETAARFEALR